MTDVAMIASYAYGSDRAGWRGLRSTWMKRVVRIVVITFVAAVVLIGGRWYMYVAHSESPYDEVGIELNSRMPAPLRTWGCARIAARFAGAITPYGCTTTKAAPR